MTGFNFSASPGLVASATLLGASLAYHVGTLLSALKWKRESQGAEGLVDATAYSPPVTIFKPLRGTDPELYLNLRSFCEQNYPVFQIIFCALDPQDPAIETANRLREEFPDRTIYVIVGGTIRGFNLKVSTLLEMMPAAQFDLLVIADSDMRVGPKYLRTVTAPFSQAGIGLVTCPYRGVNPRGVAGVFEGISIGSEFIPSAFLAYFAFGQRFAFGSTIAIRKSVLEKIGGFESMVDLLADDYALADRTARAGYGVHLSSYVVDDVLGSEPPVSVWRRRLRWAKTARVLRPGPYFGLFITFLTPLAIMTSLLVPNRLAAFSLLAGSLAIRVGIATTIAARATRDMLVLRWLILVPVSELLSTVVWVLSLLGRKVYWRGDTFSVSNDGKLVGN